MKRVAALLAAVAMVAGAWAVRDLLVEDDGGGGAGDVPEQLRLTCATELALTCEQVAASVDGVVLSVQDPGLTADSIAQLADGEDPGFDAWLADGPWAAMAADDRSFAGVEGAVMGEPSEVLVRSPALVVVQSSRQGALTEACGATITWRCIGEQAASFRVGLASPDRGDGLVPLAEATASFFDTTDYSAVDFEEPGFSTWFDSLTGLSTRTALGRQSALATALTRAGTFNVVGALEAQSTTLLRGRDGWSAIYPEPMSIAEVQLVPRAGLDAEDLLDRLGGDGLTTTLTDAGWRSATGGADAPVAIPDGSGLPSAGVLNALRDRW